MKTELWIMEIANPNSPLCYGVVARWGWSYVMKVEKAPMESYADIGGLDAQIQEIKEVVVELPFTHPFFLINLF